MTGNLDSERAGGSQGTRDALRGLESLARLVIRGGRGSFRRDLGPFAELLSDAERDAEGREVIRCSGDLVLPADGDAFFVLRTEKKPGLGVAYD